MDTSTRYYFDMDGTLARYDRHVYQNDPPLFIDPENHYFLSCVPNKDMLNVLSYYVRKSHQAPDTEVVILTSMLPGSIGYAHWKDKQLWLDAHLPYDVAANIVLMPVFGDDTKAKAARRMRNAELSFNDILIDDYNRNLDEWSRAGGTAIKYLNGENSPESFNGLHITPSTMNAEQIIDFLSAKNLADTKRLYKPIQKG